MSNQNNELPNNPEINSENLKPFSKFCMTIGVLPSSYVESLTYQELLLWFCDFLENTVIPAVNNNAEALTELQNLFIELKNYVDNYFNGLDVQEEINKKLDMLVTDGTLSSLISPIVSEYFIPFKNEVDNISQKINDNNKIVNDLSIKVNSAVGITPIPVNSIEEMSDISKIYVLTSDGNWYYYNESWKIGGSYQSDGISDNSITKQMTTFYSLSPNSLLDPSTLKPNYYIDSNNGNEIYNENPVFHSSDYIEVKPNSPYTANQSNQWAWYDKEKTYISGNSNTDLPYQTRISPSNAKYLRITVNSNYINIDDFIISNSGVPLDTPLYQLLSDMEYFDKRYIGYTKSVNLFDKNDCLKNYFIDNTGTTRPATTDCYLTDFIELNYNDIIQSNNNIDRYTSYDENYNFIGYVSLQNTILKNENQNVKFVRLLVLEENSNECMITYQKDFTNYIPKYLANIPKKSISKDMLNFDISSGNSSKLANKSICFMGDSITYGLNGSTHEQTEKPYPTIIKDNSNCISYNYGINGSTLGGVNTGSNNPMIERIKNIPNSDIIVIFGGSNDFGSGVAIPLGTSSDKENTSFYGSLDIMCNYLLNNFPTKKYCFITPLRRGSSNYKNNFNNSLDQYANAIIQKCKEYCIPYLDLYNFYGFNTYNSSIVANIVTDSVHPNQIGYNILADKIQSFLETL